MDSSEVPVEQEPNSTLIANDAATQMHSTVAEVEVEDRDIPSSRINKEMLSFHEYVMGLNDEEWTSFSHAMSNPVTKLQFFKVCMNVTKLVTRSSMKTIILGLARKLAKDPNLLRPAHESARVNIIDTSGPSITYTENDQDILEIKNGCLTKVIPKLSSSRSSVRSSDKSALHGDFTKRSKSSQGSASLAEFGINEDQIRAAGFIPGSDEWLDAIVREAVHKINMALSVKISDLTSSARGTVGIQNASSPELMKADDLVLASTNGNGKHHTAGSLLSTTVKAVKTMACQSISVKESDALARYDHEEEQVTDLASREFYSKVLEKLSTEISSCGTCLASSPVPANMDINMDEKDLSSKSSFQQRSSSSFCDTFVENVVHKEDYSVASSSSMTLSISDDKQSSMHATKTLNLTSSESASLPCVQNLSCENFQRDVLRALSEAVLKFSRSPTSNERMDQHPESVQVNSFFFLPVEAEDTEAQKIHALIDVHHCTKDEFQNKTTKQMSELLHQPVRPLTDSLHSENTGNDACTSEEVPLFFPQEVEYAASELVETVMEQLQELLLLDITASSDAPPGGAGAVPISNDKPNEPKPNEQEKAQSRFLPFLRKMSKIKACLNISLKRSKSANKKTSPSVDQNSDPSTDANRNVLCVGCFPFVGRAASSSDKIPTTSGSSEKGHCQGFFYRMFCRKSTKISPETF